MSQFSLEIRALRKSLGLSQAKFAQHLEVSTSTVVRWEAGKGEPKSQHVWRRIHAVAKAALGGL